MIETIGFAPDGVGNALPSPIQTPGTSCSSPEGFATLVCGSGPMRHVPIWCALNGWTPFAPIGRRFASAMKASTSSPKRQRGKLGATRYIALAPVA